MSKRFSLLLILLLALTALPAAATTVVVGTDEDLFDQAPVVLEGTVLGSAPAHGRPAIEYQVRVERILKGRVNAGNVVVRVIGGDDANGMHLTVWGAPSLQTGEKTLLFLVRQADGTYGPLHLALGAFHEVQTAGGQKVAFRNLRDMQDVTVGGAKEAQDSVRDAGRFAGWLADRAAGLKRSADYFVSLPASDLRRLQEKFTYLGGIKQRWTVFDGGGAVGWRIQASGQPGLDDGGVSEFQNALAAWDNDPSTNIKYRFDGTTDSTSGFQAADGINAIIFEDPNKEVPGTFTCVSPGRGSGVLAIGGTWSTRPGAGGVGVIGEGDIVTNDGVGCWFNTPKRAEQVFTHELGHTLGLGHSCGDDSSGPCVAGSLEDDAVMRAQAHADERGARLNDDDRAGILTLYPGSSTPPPVTPATPTNLVATAVSASAIQLTWTDNATNETSYRVEMKSTGSYAVVKNLSANATSVTVDGLAAGTAYTFRVQARTASTFSAFSNEASATTTAAAQPPAAPSNLTATPVPNPGSGSNFLIRLDWKNNSTNETQFVIDMIWPDLVGTVTLTIDPHVHSFIVDGRTPNVPYTFRIRAQNAAGTSAPSNEASATALDLPAGACVPGAQNLCLQGNRFRVSVRWRTSTANGSGTAVPQSDQTGLFWFFGPANIELIVKMIDGRGLNNFFWTFYGGLSDQEYWITVADTQNGSSKTYHNDPGSLCGLGDVNAFTGPSTGSDAAPVSLATVPDKTCAPGSLCLFGGRFQATVTWHTPDGHTGAGTPLTLTDVSGMFWFFDPANIELVVKVIDARTVNGKFWVFYGALSDVQYDLTVTDTTTGLSHTYHNNQGNLCGKGDTSTFGG